MSGTVGILGVTLVVWVPSLERLGRGRPSIAALTAYMIRSIGFAAGPLIFGPTSEVVGRRLVYVCAGVGYSAFSFGAAFAPSAAALLIFRFFVGFFGGAFINNVPASIGDYTTPVQRGPFSILCELRVGADLQA